MFATIVRKRIRHIRNKYLPYFNPVAVERRKRLNSSFRWVDRSKGSKHMVQLICGYKPQLWEAYFDRILRFTPQWVDVCIVCPGFTENKELEAIAQRNAWSILLCKKNRVSIAQNLAIAQHPAAEVLYKLDEDILISKHYFVGMGALIEQVENESRFEAGFYAPLLHVNGYGYHRVLDLLNKTSQYEEQFGPISSQCVDIPIWSDGKAAGFMWDAIYPLDDTADRLFDNGERFTVCPHRFSIGAIVFYRSTWEDLNYFVNAPEGLLGMDEIQIAEYCARECKVMIVSDEVLAGHFSFGPQYEWMTAYLSQNRNMLNVTS